MHRTMRIFSVLLLLVVPCWTASLSFSLSAKLSLSARPSAPRKGLEAHRVHSWRIDKESTCSGPLVVEFWEEHSTAAAAPPLVNNLVLCPLLSTRDYPTLASAAGAKSPYTQWESMVGEPWSDDAYVIPGLWWDREAAARQLPYHRTQVKVGTAAPVAGTWWLHVINRRGTAVPKYHIRATCAASIPCPEPLLGAGPCAGHGTCRAVQGLDGLGWSYQTSACDCKAGRGGVGCEVDVPSLALGTPTTVVPTYNADMKLIWTADINTSWSLYTVKVPKADKLVVELSIDWSTAPVLLAPANLPRLCVATGNQASHSGRLLPRKMDCQDPLDFPLGFATGATYDMGTAVMELGANATASVQILVMDVGSYPVQLTARASTGAKGDSCPFSCSQQPSMCGPTGGCSCPAEGLGGQLCQYSYYTEYNPQFDFDAANYLISMATSPSIQLAAGESAWWVLKLPDRASGTYIYSPKGHPMRVRWEAEHQMAATAAPALNASAYQMELYGNGETPHKDPVPSVACWQTNETPFFFRDLCLVGAPAHIIGLQLTNTNQQPVAFTVFLEGYSSSGSSTNDSQYGANPVDYSRGALAAFGVLVVCSAVAFLYRFRMARRAIQSAMATRALNDLESGTGGAGTAAQRHAAAKYGVPKDVIDTFPTEVYTPPAAAPAKAAVAGSTDTSSTPDQQAASTVADKSAALLHGAGVELANLQRQVSAPMRDQDSQAPAAADAGRRPRDGAGSTGLRRASSGGLDTLFGGALRRVGRALSGVPPAAVPDRPTDGADLCCTICLDEYAAGEVLRRLPCQHTFHQPCIDAWMDSNHTCPVCRQHLVEAPSTSQASAPPQPA